MRPFCLGSGPMRIATWNINSVRLREKLVLKMLAEFQPDILCLQETKKTDAQFPTKGFRKAGYEYLHFNGMPGYNGVAILSKIPFDDVAVYNRCDKDDSRHISASLKPKGFDRALHIHGLYIPAGGDEPDREINPKFGHKLDFIKELTEFFPSQYSDQDAVIALGDFNIAPQEHDVWSHKQLLKVVSHTPIEVEHLSAMQESLSWIDTAREFVDSDEKLYSWWSYRARDWQKSNRGRRLDHLWVTPALKPYLKAHHTPEEWRGKEKPSDHVPVIIDFDFQSA